MIYERSKLLICANIMHYVNNELRCNKDIKYPFSSIADIIKINIYCGIGDPEVAPLGSAGKRSSSVNRKNNLYNLT